MTIVSYPLQIDTVKMTASIDYRTRKASNHSIPLFLKYLGILILLLLINQQTANAWDLELGVHHLMPKLSTGEQKYENASGAELKFKPVINKTITGQSASIGLIYEKFAFQLEQVSYQYESDILTEYAAVINGTSAKIEMKEQRVGVNYHLERELAGLFAGIGMTRETEKITTGGGEWIYEADVPFIKIGIDLILNSWRIRIEQVYFSFGEHSSKVSSFGILLYL